MPQGSQWIACEGDGKASKTSANPLEFVSIWEHLSQAGEGWVGFFFFLATEIGLVHRFSKVIVNGDIHPTGEVYITNMQTPSRISNSNNLI